MSTSRSPHPAGTQTFLIERFWPGVTPAGARAAARRLDVAAAGFGRLDRVRHVRTGLLPNDEVVWSMVEARSAEAVIAVTTLASHPVDRISETIVVGGRRR